MSKHWQHKTNKAIQYIKAPRPLKSFSPIKRGNFCQKRWKKARDKVRYISNNKTRWWQLKDFFIFTPKIGEDSHVDSYFSDGLVQPPTRKASTNEGEFFTYFPASAKLIMTVR